MYFTNISDNELTQYHQQVKNNFSITIHTILTNTLDLFKIEEITDTVLKIYPLFYCEKITSTNPNDKITDNKLIICEKNNNTRLTFITSPDEQISINDIGFTSLLTDTMQTHNPLFLFYSKKDRRILSNVKVTVKLTDYKGNNYSDEGYSNADGLVYLPNLFNDGGVIYAKIVIEYNNQSITYENRLDANIKYGGDLLLTDIHSTGELVGSDIELVFDDETVIEYTDKSSFNHPVGDGLHSLSFNGVITELGEYCFYNCADLVSVSFSDDVESLGVGCFDSCTGLVFVNLPNSVIEIGESCFYGCTGLDVIVLNWESSETILDYDEDWAVPNNVLFSIPQGTKSLYESKGYPSNRLVERSE